MFLIKIANLDVREATTKSFFSKTIFLNKILLSCVGSIPLAVVSSITEKKIFYNFFVKNEINTFLLYQNYIKNKFI